MDPYRRVWEDDESFIKWRKRDAHVSLHCHESFQGSLKYWYDLNKVGILVLKSAVWNDDAVAEALDSATFWVKGLPFLKSLSGYRKVFLSTSLTSTPTSFYNDDFEDFFGKLCQVFIADHFFKSSLSKDFCFADIQVEVEIEPVSDCLLTNFSLEAVIYDTASWYDGKVDFLASSVAHLKLHHIPNPVRGFHGYILGGKLESPKLWSDEQPNLYMLVVILKDGSG